MPFYDFLVSLLSTPEVRRGLSRRRISLYNNYFSLVDLVGFYAGVEAGVLQAHISKHL